jgi:hypothetical protein
MKKLLLTSFLIFFAFTKASAGWYICYNYVGTIDNKLPIHLCIQIENDWGHPQKIRNVFGIYVYDNHNNPIKLKGTLTDGKTLELYEFVAKQKTAVFKFDLSLNDESNGNWQNLKTKEMLPINLKKISYLYDDEGSIPYPVQDFKMESVAILQNASFEKFYFIGIYSMNTAYQSAHMTELKIMNKRDNTVFQTIDFTKLDFSVGNIMTIIFDNVEIRDKQEFIVTYKDRQMGSNLVIKYNPKTKKFKLNPKPESAFGN